MTSRWNWTSTADIARELGLDDKTVEEVVRHAAEKGWLEIDNHEGTRFRLNADLMTFLAQLQRPPA